MELFYLKKLLVSFDDLFSVVELVSVEHAPHARFVRNGRKISILECCRFQA